MPLSPEDAAQVLRRAAELDTPSLEAHDQLDEQGVRDAAREVGLSDAAVEQAVQEWRTGVLAPLPELSPDRVAGLTATVAVETRVALAPEAAERAVSRWLQEQWFERRRTRGPESTWAPRRGLAAKARRAVDVQHRLRLRDVSQVRACVAPAASGSRVRLVADLGDTRTGLLVGLVAAPALVVTGAALVLGVDPTGLGELVALPAAAGTGGAGWLVSRRLLSRVCSRVEDELERALDEIATGPARDTLVDRAAAWAAQRLPRQLLR